MKGKTRFSKKKACRRILAVLMTIAMTIGLIPMGFLGGNTIVKAADTEISWDFRLNSGTTPTKINVDGKTGRIEDGVGSDRATKLVVENSEGKTSKFTNCRNNAQMNNGTKLSVPLSGTGTIAIATGSSTNTSSCFNVEGLTHVSDNNGTITYTYDANSADTATITATSNIYINSITVNETDKTPIVWDFNLYGSVTGLKVSIQSNTGTIKGSDGTTDITVDATVEKAKLSNMTDYAQINAGTSVDVPVDGTGTLVVEASSGNAQYLTITGANADTSGDIITATFDASEIVANADGKKYVRISNNTPSTSAKIKSIKLTMSTEEKSDVEAVVKYDGATLATVTGKIGNTSKEFSNVVQTPTSVSVTEAIEDSKLSIEASENSVAAADYKLLHDSSAKTITIYKDNNSNSTVDDNETLKVITYSIAGVLGTLNIGDGEKSYDTHNDIFGLTSISAGSPDLNQISADGYVKLKSYVSEAGAADFTNGHGVILKKGTTVFSVNVPANSVGAFTVLQCEYNNAAMVTMGTSTKNLNGGTCNGRATVTYTNTTNATKEVDITINITGGQIYVPGIAYVVNEIPSVATVKGKVEGVSSGTLKFAATVGSDVETEIGSDGSYSVELAVGTTYTVSISGVSGCKIDPAVNTLDLTSVAAGSTVTDKNFATKFWDATKTGTITVGGSVFTITAGASETADFTVEKTSGDGFVQLVTSKAAVVWANLGGAGKGTASNVEYTGSLSGTVSDNVISLTLSGDKDPKTFEVHVRDNSATGVPEKDGKPINYDLRTDAPISKLTLEKPLTGGASVTTTDKLVTFVGNNKLAWHDTTHGIELKESVIKVKVAGNASVVFAGCNLSKANATITASSSTGNVYLTSDANKSEKTVNAQTSSDGGAIAFTYEGDATELTFTFGGGQHYLHGITVTNEALSGEKNPNYTPDAIPTWVEPAGSSNTVKFTEMGQQYVVEQTSGDSNPVNMSMLLFPETKTNNKLDFDVVISSGTIFGGIVKMDSKSTSGFYFGSIKGTNNAVQTANTKTGEGVNTSGHLSKSYTAGTIVHYTVERVAGDSFKFTITTTDDTYEYTEKYSSGNPQYTANIATYDDAARFGILFNNCSATVTNMVYTDASGKVLYDQNQYYLPMGTAPVAASADCTVAQDRTKITVNWAGDDAKFDGLYTLQVSKDGAEYQTVSSNITTKSYDYLVANDASGEYKFRVFGTLGRTDAQKSQSKTAAVETPAKTIIAALEKVVVNVGIVSPADKVTLNWNKVSGATGYEVYRRSSDENERTKIATVTENTYVDTDVTAEVPYYYAVKAICEGNFSNIDKEVWTLPTNGHTGKYDYDATINVTDRSFNTVFTNKVFVEAVATANGTATLYVNGTNKGEKAVTNGTAFKFEDIEIAQGRNDVTIELAYAGGRLTKKSLNFVYLTNYDIVVDTSDTSYPAPIQKFSTVTAALDSVSSTNETRKVILVRNGSYDEGNSQIIVTKPNVTIIGEDSEKTLIHCYPGNVGGDTKLRCAVYVQSSATGFVAENLCLQNDWDYQGTSSAGNGGNESADVMLNEADKSAFFGVRFLGYQDTLNLNKNKQYFNKCFIAGNVDFIYGADGQVLFDDCDIQFRYNANKNSGYVTAMKTSEALSYGLIFKDCRIQSENECSGTSYYLGRPWGEFAAVTYINCYMGEIVNKASAFRTWGGKDYSTDEIAFAKTRYYEYNSYGPGYEVNQYRRQISPNKAASMLSVSGLGWDPYTTATSVATKYIGSVETAPNTGSVKNEYTSDKYSQYDGDDSKIPQYRLEGYAANAATTGGGLLKETNKNYYKVANAEEFLTALTTIKSKKAAAVIEITADINLGDKEVKDFDKYSGVVAAHSNAPISHPDLMASGVSKLNLKGFNSLTIFSSNGSSIKHCSIDIAGSNNIIIRNIAFDELWEWDEATEGAYDRNDWDYMVIQNGSDRIWIDHCTFYKAYDGVVDIKTNVNTPSNVTISWCNFLPGSEGNVFFDKMMNTMKAAPEKYPYYKSLVDSGMDEQQIYMYAYGQKKTHLLGQQDGATENANLNVTFANNNYYNSMDRLPRLRYGNAHVYNMVANAQELYDARMSITNPDAAKHIVSNGASSTCDGKLLVENSYISGIINALNSGNGDSPSGYINAINSLYFISGVQYKLEPKVNNSDKATDRTLKVLDADKFKASLPYSDYILYDAAELDKKVTPFVGAGVLKLTNLQWEKTAYYAEGWTQPEKPADKPTENLPEVKIPIMSISINKDFVSLPLGTTETLSVIINPEETTDDKTVTWSSSDEKIIKVDETGKLTTVKVGSAVITAKVGDKSATCKVTVTKNDAAKKLKLSEERLTLDKGAKAKLLATFEYCDPEDKVEIIWGTSDKNVVTVSNGNVTAVGEGSAVITAKAGKLEAQCIVLVSYEDNKKNFVARLYMNILNRTPDEEGFKFWNEKIAEGSVTGTDLAKLFIGSDEFENSNVSNEEYVATLYRTILGREPEEDGFNYWCKELDSGISRYKVFVQVAASGEYKDICDEYGMKQGSAELTSYRDQNDGVAKFIYRMYKTALDRTGEDEGMEFWAENVVTGKLSLESLASNFVFSKEMNDKNLSDEDFIKVLYKSCFDREPDAEGFAFWVEGLSSKRFTREDALRGFADSKEFNTLKAKFGLN